MSKEVNITESEAKVKISSRLPRKLKRQLKKLGEQVNPVSPPSQPSRTAHPASHGVITQQPKAAVGFHQPKKPRPRKFTRVVLIRLVGELSQRCPDLDTELRRHVSLTKAREKTLVKVFAKKVAAGTALGPLLVGYDSTVLDIAEAIVRFIWHPQPKTPKESAPKKDSKRVLTDAQLAQRQHDLANAASQPAMTPDSSSYTAPKGAPKTVPRRETVDDATIIEEALRELLRSDKELRLRLCSVTLNTEFRRLLWTDEQVTRLAEYLKNERVTAPSRVSSHIETAAKRIIDDYRQEDEALKQNKARRKAARHRKLVSTA